MSKTDFVTFEDSDGNTISSDPRFLAQQTLAEAGVEGRKPDFDIAGPYDDLDGDQLKALAKEREISTRGFRKASQYREALEDWDEAQAESEEDPDNENDDSDDENSSGDSDDK